MAASITDSKYRCPHCGHPTMPTDPLAILTPMQRVIFDVVYKAGTPGIDSQALRERAYNGTTGGTSSQLLGAHITGINQRIRFLGLRIDSQKAGKYGAVYNVNRTTEVEKASHTLTEEIVRKIRQDARPVGRLAKAFGVNRRTIERIRNRETWRHVQ